MKKNPLDPVREAAAAKALRESILAAVGGEDEALLIDAIEGETNLFEMIDALLERRADSLGLAEGVAKAIERLEVRKRRFEARAEADKALVEQALSIAEVKTVERPIGTLTMARRAPSLVIAEESDIPAKYWKAGEPKLDRKALAADLAARAKAIAALPEDPAEREAAIAELPPEIPGASLSNGAPSLTVRTT